MNDTNYSPIMVLFMTVIMVVAITALPLQSQESMLDTSGLCKKKHKRKRLGGSELVIAIVRPPFSIVESSDRILQGI